MVGGKVCTLLGVVGGVSGRRPAAGDGERGRLGVRKKARKRPSEGSSFFLSRFFPILFDFFLTSFSNLFFFFRYGTMVSGI